uniref:Uncharacterized protein n=1 Tax=Ursus maritimus TaxID=29073 RepID=A0A452TLW2_URSMA
MQTPAMMSLLLVCLGLMETFQVINASRPAQGPARVYLRALGKRSTYNCEYIKGRQAHAGRHLSMGQGSASAVWSLLLPLWVLVGGTFPRPIQH